MARQRFYYNRSVTNVNVTNIRNVYNTTVINRGGENRVSYNGGHGGLTVRPTSAEEAAARGRHTPPIAAQTEPDSRRTAIPYFARQPIRVSRPSLQPKNPQRSAAAALQRLPFCSGP